MKIEDILTLAKAGFTAKQIQDLEPKPDPAPNPAVPQTPTQNNAPKTYTAQEVMDMMRTVWNANNTNAQTPQSELPGGFIPEEKVPEVQPNVTIKPTKNEESQSYLVQQIAQLQAQNRALATGQGMQKAPNLNDITQQIVNGGIVEDGNE